MSIQTIIFLFLGAAVLFLVAANALLLRHFYKTNRRIDKLLENGKIKDFKNILLSQKGKNEELEEEIREALKRIKNLEDISEITIRKTGVVRFNPFSDVGGNQSFVIALLDNKDNGFLISSLFVKDGNRVYAKAIKNGKSDHLLSGEEKQALEKAINDQR